MGSCHARESEPTAADILLVGNPNVGKSALFHHLTGVYATVSNYPGTTVTLDHGKATLDGEPRTVTDTPGMYGLVPLTEEERVASDLVLTGRPRAVVCVADAGNLARALHVPVQLREEGLPVRLAVNLLDEAEARGIRLDLGLLSRRLQIPVVGTVAVGGRGIEDLRRAIAAERPDVVALHVPYDAGIEAALSRLAPVMPRGAALRFLAGDDRPLAALDDEARSRAEAARRDAETDGAFTAGYRIHMARQRWIDRLLQGVRSADGPRERGRLGERLGRLTAHPVWGVPFLAVAVYLGLYQFVGVLGAGTLVDLLETRLFERIVNPWFSGLVERHVPWAPLADLLAGEYGVVTLGVRYAVAIIFPIVGTFFLVFSVIEDSGYLPRLAMLIDRVFKRIGLNGRAVIPMTLGFGCGTMATMVTRTLETRRERLLATLLLALAVPCSAQLGVVFAILAAHPGALGVWMGAVAAVFLLVGFLAARVLPGERPAFYMELPPLRLPRLGNVLTKTATRMVWYFKEIVPIFLAASVLIWLGVLTGVFDAVVAALRPVVGALGLPAETAPVFLYGFFRRDYGAAGLYDLQDTLTGNQVTVAAVVLTLFTPCVAQAAIMFKERGWKTGLGILAFILPASFLAGLALHRALTALGVSL